MCACNGVSCIVQYTDVVCVVQSPCILMWWVWCIVQYTDVVGVVYSLLFSGKIIMYNSQDTSIVRTLWRFSCQSKMITNFSCYGLLDISLSASTTWSMKAPPKHCNTSFWINPLHTVHIILFPSQNKVIRMVKVIKFTELLLVPTLLFDCIGWFTRVWTYLMQFWTGRSLHLCRTCPTHDRPRPEGES